MRSSDIPKGQKGVYTNYNTTIKNLYFQVVNTDNTIKNIDISTQTEEKTLKNVLSNKPSLIVYFSENNCGQCVDSVLKYTLKLKDAIKDKRIIGIANYSDKRSLMVYKEYNKIPFDVFSTIDNSIEMDLINENSPFLFLTDSTLRIRCLFIPNKSYSKYTEIYLMAIDSLLSKTKPLWIGNP